MALRLHAATNKDLAALLDRCQSDALTYGPPGISLGGPTPAGLTRRGWSTVLPGAGAGADADVFDRAVAAIRAWAVHRGAGLTVAADGPITPATNVAFSAPLPVGFVEGTCRIVSVVNEQDRFGFAYGTLPIHPERGEESFVVTCNRDDNTVRFDVEAVSRPSLPLARLFPPAADRLQHLAVRRYLAAMERAVAP